MEKRVVIIGAGISILEGIELNLWNRIKGKADIWSVNFAFMTMPYLPNREIWTDYSFFKKNIEELQKIGQQGVEMCCKYHPNYVYIPTIKSYDTTREKLEYWGKLGKEKNKIFSGTQGLSGVFALSLAIAEEYKTIFLLGFDYGIPFNSTDNSFTHYYQKKLNVESSGFRHPENYLTKDLKAVKPDVQDFSVYLQHSDIKIWNVSLESHIHQFEKISYPTFFEALT